MICPCSTGPRGGRGGACDGHCPCACQAIGRASGFDSGPPQDRQTRPQPTHVQAAGARGAVVERLLIGKTWLRMHGLARMHAWTRVHGIGWLKRLVSVCMLRVCVCWFILLVLCRWISWRSTRRSTSARTAPPSGPTAAASTAHHNGTLHTYIHI